MSYVTRYAHSKPLLALHFDGLKKSGSESNNAAEMDTDYAFVTACVEEARVRSHTTRAAPGPSGHKLPSRGPVRYLTRLLFFD